MAQEKTLTVLENCVVAYAKKGKVTSKGSVMLSGIVQQLTPEGKFQASTNFACFEADVQEHILSVASKIAEAEQSAESTGNASLTVESAERQKATVTVTIEGYHQTRAPKENGGKWWNSFIITKVQLVDNAAVTNQA